MMNSTRPYFIRALYDWIVDNRLTPHLLVDASAEGLVAPTEFANDGRLVLNVSPDAVRDLELANDFIEFSARFRGVSRDVIVPLQAVLGIYARENGQGMLFGDEQEDSTGTDDDPGSSPPRPQGRPTLKIVT